MKLKTLTFKKIIIGSNNIKKVEEIKSIFSFLKIEFSSLRDHLAFQGVEETGKTFLENAILKAKQVYQQFSLPTLADDSGLIVPLFNNQPGIYSSRYAGEPPDDVRNNRKLIENLKQKKIVETYAYFKTMIVLYDPSRGILVIGEGKIKGKIITQPRGENGFGYDPLFVPQGRDKTFAEMSKTEKNKISHRQLALRDLLQRIRG